jgi:hypothetical protein
VRIRIALTTAVAVFIALLSFIFALFSSTSAASTRASRHETVDLRHGAGVHQAVRIGDKLTSYTEARPAAQVATSADAVQAAREATFFEDLTYLKEMSFIEAVARQEAGSLATMPAAWVPTALCEESGRDDPYAGFFGILEWNHFDGYPTAGSAPLAVQLAWEAAHGQGPPDAPGQCHGY